MTSPLVALLDSNVVIAALAEEHGHHRPSLALLGGMESERLAVAAHSFAEAYSTSTRSGPRRGFGRSRGDALNAPESVAAIVTLLGLGTSNMLDDIRLYAQSRGVGARLYDHLIGRVAVRNGIPRIVTWNVRHMRDLFSALDVVDPAAALAA